MQHYHFRALCGDRVISAADMLAASEAAAISRAADIREDLQADAIEIWSGTVLLYRGDAALLVQPN